MLVLVKVSGSLVKRLTSKTRVSLQAFSLCTSAYTDHLEGSGPTSLHGLGQSKGLVDS